MPLRIHGSISPDRISTRKISEALSCLPLGGIRCYSSATSTNNIALKWAAAGAKDMSLVFSDAQTAGRGRNGNQWYSPPGAGLLFSLILDPGEFLISFPHLVNGMVALGIVHALTDWGVSAQIKFPNDVIINQRKVGGILSEFLWDDGVLKKVIVGIGVNCYLASMPPEDLRSIPATCVQLEIDRTLYRLDLLAGILKWIIKWRSYLGKDDFMLAWNSCLAYKDTKVAVYLEDGTTQCGMLAGLNEAGWLILVDENDNRRWLVSGDVHLRPVL